MNGLTVEDHITIASQKNPYLHSVATNPLVSKRKGLYTVTFSTF